MTRAEVAEVLAVAARIDPRFDFDRDTVEVWHGLLSDVPVEKAREAVKAHYRSSTHRLMPADIVRAAAPRSREQWL